MSQNAIWYLMRGTGMVSLVLFTAVAVLGIATTTRLRLAGLPRFATLALHRSISLLAVVFLAIHVSTALIDQYAAVRVVDVFVPFFAHSLHPFYLGLGALALELVAAVAITSVVRQHIGQRAWRATHWLAYVAWPVALVHSIGNGTDAATPWFRATAVVCVLAVAASVVWRLRHVSPSPTPLRAPTPRTLRPTSR